MMRTITSIMGNSQRLDGGAMFGNAPKPLWQRWTSPDAQNRIPLACRAMLVRDGGRNILFETGIGAFFEPRLRERYGVVEEGHVLLESLAAEGLTHEDIHIVVLSHLHFDHAGGMLSAHEEGRAPELLFPNAQVLVSTAAWQRCQRPHARDRASFIPQLTTLLEQSGRLSLVDGNGSDLLGEGYRFHRSDGHTPGLLLTEVDTPWTSVVFAGDLIPGTPWVHIPITMGYDRYPELLIDEKRAFLESLITRKGHLFYAHDPDVALSGVAMDERERFRAVDGAAHVRDWTGKALL